MLDGLSPKDGHADLHSNPDNLISLSTWLIKNEWDGHADIVCSPEEAKFKWDDPPTRYEVTHLLFRYFGSIPTGDGFSRHLTSSHVPSRACDNMAQVSAWINSCLSDHDKCRKVQQDSTNAGQLPARLLDLERDRISLKCDVAGNDSIQYLTLSHMWGPNPTQQLQLVTSRLKEFQLEVPLQEMSVIFKEAVRITRALGFRYLWIDSLCIIQDSSSDWEQEASKMATTYGNAVCSIAFLFPPGNNGMVLRKDPRRWNACVVRDPTRDSKGIWISRLNSRSAIRRHDWPLFSRAWTFQEHLLCPRTLLYGQENLMWECSEVFCDELMGSLKTLEQPHRKHTWEWSWKAVTKPKLYTQMLSIRSVPALGASAKDVLEVGTIWANLVLEYRERNLTVAKDRIMAFAGIARAIHNMTGLTYLAGTWLEYIQPCLLWSHPHDHAQKPREPGSLDAPSWSWFRASLYPRDLFDFTSAPDVHLFRKSYVRRVFWAEAVSFKFPSHPKNHVPQPAFYNFAGLRLTLNALTVRTSYALDFESCLPTRIEALYGGDSSAQIDCCYDSHPLQRKKELLGDVRLALIMEFEYLDHRATYSAGLLLVPGLEEQTWRRIGVWTVDVCDIPPEHGRVQSVLNLLGECRVEEVTLV
ncbi:HET-domain-containing protein [Dothidotthia symphoricarpi CBS 119687]|uniref:HET-domain-containing protein n=1 Tax=Dothidotthia symphoricarpi CBS 119687 TaxID=1392245 RepID=A0A6A6A3A7_9PLEO|nr:HET-domain-containing protein [Dothidotthia symphoricarpi CBS 119687]KAF2126359.1 HET-domain-containing protein [Dothidotthia symphoricarpi CBS 119687]